MWNKRVILFMFILLLLGSVCSYVLAQELRIETMQMTLTGIEPSLAKYENSRYSVSVEYYSVNYKPFDDFSKESAKAYGGYLFSKNVLNAAQTEERKSQSNMAQFQEPLSNAKKTLRRSSDYVSNLMETGTKLLSELTTAGIPGVNMITLLPKLLSIVQTILENLRTIQTEGPKMMQSISSLLKTIPA